MKRMINLFSTMFHFYTLKTSENQRFSNAFNGYKSGTLFEYGLRSNDANIFNPLNASR